MTFIYVLYGFKCPRRQERQVKFALKRKKNEETVLQEKKKRKKENKPKSGRCYIKCLLIYVRYKSDFLTQRR